MQQKYGDYNITYQEHSSEFACSIGEVIIKDETLKGVKTKIDKFINQKSKQKPVKCFIAAYGTNVKEAIVTSINNGKIYYCTLNSKDSARERHQDSLRYLDYGYFKVDSEENRKRFEEIQKMQSQVADLQTKITQTISELEVLKKLPYMEED